MRVFGLVLAFVFSFVLAGCDVKFSVRPANKEKEVQALPGTYEQNLAAFEAAKEIIHSFDRREFEQIWEHSSLLLKNQINKTVFVNTMALTRGNLGQPAPRGEPRIGFTKTPGGDAPKGDYAVVEVDTTFGEKVVTEKVIMIRESEKWMLAGYFMNI